jgi:hypothetical protein
MRVRSGGVVDRAVTREAGEQFGGGVSGSDETGSNDVMKSRAGILGASRPG